MLIKLITWHVHLLKFVVLYFVHLPHLYSFFKTSLLCEALYFPLYCKVHALSSAPYPCRFIASFITLAKSVSPPWTEESLG